jgi:hypothetical protein
VFIRYGGKIWENQTREKILVHKNAACIRKAIYAELLRQITEAYKLKFTTY